MQVGGDASNHVRGERRQMEGRWMLEDPRLSYLVQGHICPMNQRRRYLVRSWCFGLGQASVSLILRHPHLNFKSSTLWPTSKLKDSAHHIDYYFYMIAATSWVLSVYPSVSRTSVKLDLIHSCEASTNNEFQSLLSMSCKTSPAGVQSQSCTVVQSLRVQDCSRGSVKS